MTRQRRGMSLVELMVATVLGAVVATAAIQLGASLRTSADAVSTSASLTASLHVTDRRLASLLYSALPPTDSFPFIGNSDSVHLRVSTDFTAAPGHSLSVVRKDSDVVLVVAGADVGYLRREVGAFAIDYLSARGLRSRWVPVWVSRANLPAAIRFRFSDLKTLEADTVLLSVGVRL